MPVVVITPPDQVVSLADIKAHLRITTTSQDSLLLTYLAAAQSQIDGPSGVLGRAVGVQTLELQGIDAADPQTWIKLPFPPVTSITRVSYGASITLDPSAYVFGPGDVVWPASGSTWPWLSGDRSSVRIRYVAGYSTLPGAIKAAILLAVQNLYALGARDPSLTVDTVFGVGSQQFSANATPVLTQTAEKLLAPYRVLLA